MNKYTLWVRINPLQTAHTSVYASDAYQAKLLGEAQFGVGNVLNYVQCSQR
jgi:hypothetical protein